MDEDLLLDCVLEMETDIAAGEYDVPPDKKGPLTLLMYKAVMKDRDHRDQDAPHHDKELTRAAAKLARDR